MALRFFVRAMRAAFLVLSDLESSGSLLASEAPNAAAWEFLTDLPCLRARGRERPLQALDRLLGSKRTPPGTLRVHGEGVGGFLGHRQAPGTHPSSCSVPEPSGDWGARDGPGAECFGSLRRPFYSREPEGAVRVLRADHPCGSQELSGKSEDSLTPFLATRVRGPQIPGGEVSRLVAQRSFFF